MSLSIKKQLSQNNTEQLAQWNRKLTDYTAAERIHPPISIGG